MSGITLSDDERRAAAFAVAHLIEKHDYLSLVSLTAPVVRLDELYAKLTKTDPQPHIPRTTEEVTKD